MGNPLASYEEYAGLSLYFSRIVAVRFRSLPDTAKEEIVHMAMAHVIEKSRDDAYASMPFCFWAKVVEWVGVKVYKRASKEISISSDVADDGQEVGDYILPYVPPNQIDYVDLCFVVDRIMSLPPRQRDILIERAKGNDPLEIAESMDLDIFEVLERLDEARDYLDRV